MQKISDCYGVFIDCTLRNLVSDRLKFHSNLTR